MSATIASALWIKGSASAAPLPSPSRRPKSSSGSSPSASRTSVWPGPGQLAREANAAFDRPYRLCPRHRRSLSGVARAGGDAQLVDPHIPNGLDDASIDHRELGAGAGGEDVDRRPAGSEVLEHLPRH